jgi:hypothetical protein
MRLNPKSRCSDTSILWLLIANADFALVSLYCVDEGSVADVSETHSIFTFSVDVSTTCECSCTCRCLSNMLSDE